jgi:serine/threonine protein kinase/tetratricopeptide (TPR) repeat protein
MLEESVALALPPPRIVSGPKGLARYEILRPIGRGGMGVVYEALDRERQRLVALKTLRHSTPAALYLFKREFRALVDVHHPNLVELYELVIGESERAFFTMELVRGTDFISHVQRRSDALRPALGQLVQGILALHRTGKLHRDIKPSNVKITPEGRVVLLDFGIATELAPATGESAHEPGETAGTARYMAPELVDAAATAASDWYSVGVMLGDAFADGLPPDLEALRRDLTRRDPAHRPLGAEIARRVGEPDADASGPLRAIEPDAKPRFVGREAALHTLRSAFDQVAAGASLTVLVAGSPGMGKSTLVRRFLDEEVRGTALVLRGRAYERESVPYKAMDSVVDALSRHLMRLDDPGTLPPLPADASALVRLFPVLRRVPALRDLGADSFEEPRSTRRRAFAALRELLRSLAERQPVVVFVDDAHWGDSDSATLFVELMRPPGPPRLLLIAAYREEEAERSPFLIETGARWPTGAEVRSIAVGPLDSSDARQLALALLGPGDERAADDIARESGGSPFLIEELAPSALSVDGGAVNLQQVVSRRLAALSDDARRMLEVIAVGGRPLPVSVVAEASGIQGSLADAIAAARANSFLRTGLRDGHEVVEPTHGRIRDIIVARLSQATIRDLHRRLAVALSAQDADSEAIALHHLGAGDAARAVRHAQRAAEQAASNLAFARSASLYRLALENLPRGSRERAHLYVRLGEVLEWAGRGAEAARAYLQAAEHVVEASSRVRLERAAAEQLLVSGRIDEGAEVLRRVLEATGTSSPRTWLGAILRLAFHRVVRTIVGLRFERRSEARSPNDRLTIDALRSFVMGFTIVDVVIATCMQAVHLLTALRSGSSTDVMHAASIELTHVANVGGQVGRRERMLGRIIDSIAAQTDDAESLAFVRAARGTALLFRGRWREALEVLDGAYANVITRRASWRSNANVFATYALFCSGDLVALGPRQARALVDAELRGDLYTEVSLRTVTIPATCLAHDDPDAARRHVREAMARWSHRSFLVQHWQAMRAEAEIALYVGDARSARERLARDRTAVRRSFLLSGQFLRISDAYVRGRCAVASAIGGPRRRSDLVEARRVARSLQREEVPHSAPLAAIVRAGVASVAGERAVAARTLHEAMVLGKRAGMALHVEAARYQLGRLLGGCRGQRLVEQATAAFSARGVRAPHRYASMICPGRFEPNCAVPQ